MTAVHFGRVTLVKAESRGGVISAQFLLNIAVALVLGTVIGVERQWRQHQAGLRTNALVALGAALFVSLSRLMGDEASPTRIASPIIGSSSTKSSLMARKV